MRTHSSLVQVYIRTCGGVVGDTHAEVPRPAGVIKKRSEVSHERLTVKRAVLLFMETWGLGSRNIFLTMWHLLWRPGHMISDYINGRRSRYMQPFFMFFVLTLILVQTAWIMDVRLPKNKDMTVTAFQLLRDYGSHFSND